MDELVMSKIKETVRGENDSLFEKIKEWANEKMVTKEGYLKDQMRWNEDIISPMRTKLNALWISLSMVGGLAAIVFFFK